MGLEAVKRLAAQGQQLPSVIPTERDPNRELHIDGDYAAYYFSGNDETSLASAKANMLDAFRVVRQIGAVGGRVVVHLSASGGNKGLRYHIATVKDYQGQRGGSRRPKNWEGMRTFLEEGLHGEEFIVKIWKDREADDGVAAAARFAHEKGKLPVIFSRDKDFRMMPGLHIVWTTYEAVLLKPGTFSLVATDESLQYGDKWFWMQMLMGDTADNIPGLEKQPAKEAGKFKNCGESCAVEQLALIKDNDGAFIAVSVLYEAYYGDTWGDRFVEQAALLWMRTDNKADVGDFMKVVPKDLEIERALLRLRKRLEGKA